MLRPLLLVLAAAAALFGLRSWLIRIGMRGTTQRIRMDCGDSLEYQYPEADGPTTVAVKVLGTCSEPAKIRVGTPGDPGEWIDARASLLQAGERRWVGPEGGTSWLVAVPEGQTLRLECPGTGGAGCEFELTQIVEIGTSSTKLFETKQDEPIACGASEPTRIFNRSGQPVKIKITWSSVCATAQGASAPTVTITRIDPPAGTEPAADTSKAELRRQTKPEHPAAVWQKDLDANRTLSIACGAGDRGACRYHVAVVTGARGDIVGR